MRGKQNDEVLHSRIGVQRSSQHVAVDLEKLSGNRQERSPLRMNVELYLVLLHFKSTYNVCCTPPEQS